MNLALTDEQYRRLMLLTFIGEWVINAIRKDPDPAYEDTAYKVYAAAQGSTVLQSLVQMDEELETWVPSDALDDQAHALIDEYDDTTFWEEITGRLTERDLIEEHGERDLNGMRPEQRTRAAAEVAKAYTHEFEENGLERLRVQDR